MCGVFKKKVFNLENPIISCVQNNKIKKSRDNRVGLQPGSKERESKRKKKWERVGTQKYFSQHLVNIVPF